MARAGAAAAAETSAAATEPWLASAISQLEARVGTATVTNIPTGLPATVKGASAELGSLV